MHSRKSNICPIFGHSTQLKDNVLPSYADIIRYFLYIRKTNINMSIINIAAIIGKEVLLVWQKASLPVLSQRRINKMIVDYHFKYKNILKSINSTHKSLDFNAIVNSFKTDAINSLFDICSCKCFNFTTCTCPKEQKVPKLEQIFLMDQRLERRMIIGTIDIAVSTKLSNKIKRTASNVNLSQPSTSNTVSRSFPSKNTGTANVKQSTPQMRMNLNNVALISDRFGISDRGAAALSSAVLKDFSLVSDSDRSKIIDRSKIRRERSKLRNHLLSIHSTEIEGLYFDGRKINH